MSRLCAVLTTIIRFWSGNDFGTIVAFWAVFDNGADCFLDPNPVIPFCDGSSGLVDTTMAIEMNHSSNFVLPLGVSYDLFAFEHKLLRLISLGRNKFIVSGGTSQSAFFRSICSIRIFPVLEIETNFVEAFFGH